MVEYFFLVLMEMSNLLNTGLDSESLSICVKLIESGVNPEALAVVIKELRRESSAVHVSRTEISKSWGDCILIGKFMTVEHV